VSTPVTITTEAILDTFGTVGLRNTRPRRLIAQRLAELAARGEDFATDDLWQSLQQQDPQLGRATVFRAVDVLVEHGVLDRVTFADGTHRYRVCGPGAHHHHVICNVCHRVVEINMCLTPELLAAIERSTNFTLEGHSVELFGRCADCRQTALSRPGHGGN
jgi:Fur family transcriptional regulator, ferric uptake regulator